VVRAKVGEELLVLIQAERFTDQFGDDIFTYSQTQFANCVGRCFEVQRLQFAAYGAE
jgi:hypothetical protein